MRPTKNTCCANTAETLSVPRTNDHHIYEDENDHLRHPNPSGQDEATKNRNAGSPELPISCLRRGQTRDMAFPRPCHPIRAQPPPRNSRFPRERSPRRGKSVHRPPRPASPRQRTAKIHGMTGAGMTGATRVWGEIGCGDSRASRIWGPGASRDKISRGRLKPSTRHSMPPFPDRSIKASSPSSPCCFSTEEHSFPGG